MQETEGSLSEISFDIDALPKKIAVSAESILPVVLHAHSFQIFHLLPSGFAPCFPVCCFTLIRLHAPYHPHFRSMSLSCQAFVTFVCAGCDASQRPPCRGKKAPCHIAMCGKLRGVEFVYRLQSTIDIILLWPVASSFSKAIS